MDVANTFPIDNNLSAYTIEFVQDVLLQLNKKIARLSKTEMHSSKNDLSCNIDKQSFKRLTVYKNILEGILVCNPCYKNQNIEEIVSLVKNEIN